MNRDIARNEVKGRIESYLQSKGINISKPFRCLNPSHNDKTPSMSYDRKRQKCHCFGCEADYDTFDLIGIDYGLTDDKEIFKKAYEVFNVEVDGMTRETGSNEQRKTDISRNKTNHNNGGDSQRKQAEETPLADYTDYYRECMKRLGETDYLDRRGIPRDIAERFMLGYDPEWRHPKAPEAVPLTPRLIIPTSKESYVARVTDNDLVDKKYWKPKVGRVHFINIKAIKSPLDTPVFVTEGELNALSIITAGGVAVATGSASNTRLFVNYIKEHNIKAYFVIAMDNDKAGIDAAERLRKGFAEANIRYEQINLYGEENDANDILVKDRAALEKAVAEVKNRLEAEIQAEKEAEKAEYMKSSVANRVNTFWNGIKSGNNDNYYPTGFPQLDRVLEGGLYPGVYVVGAISSLGKTLFCMQICDQVAQSGRDVIVFSLEMSRDELMARSISRHTYLEAMERTGNSQEAKTQLGVRIGKRWKNYSNKELEILESAKNTYRAYASHLYIHEGIGDIGVTRIKDTVESHIRVTGNKPLVFIDYLQIMAPYHAERYGQSDKQKTDDNMLELKRLSRDLDLPILAISSLNRENYTAAINMTAFKESGAIEYSSDVLIGLQYHGMDDAKISGKGNAKTPDELAANAALSNMLGKKVAIDAKILKNRSGAKKNVVLNMIAMFNYVEDTETPAAEFDILGGVSDQTNDNYVKNIYESLNKQDQDPETRSDNKPEIRTEKGRKMIETAENSGFTYIGTIDESEEDNGLPF